MSATQSPGVAGVTRYLARLRDRVAAWRYARLARGALTRSALHGEDDDAALRREGYFSQCGQEKWLVEEILGPLRSGVFVDIGAHDGRTFSNTLYLEEQLGWSGLAVEPVPRIYEQLRRNRGCATVNACVSSRNGAVRFLEVTGYSEMLSGIVSTYDPRHRERIDRELRSRGGTCREIEVESVRLDELLLRHGMDRIDYLNIDTEGAELEILESIDLNRVRVHVIGVENNYRDYRIPGLLLRNGFRFHSIVGDEFYVNSHWAP